jgi:Arm DNA-binding domain
LVHGVELTFEPGSRRQEPPARESIVKRGATYRYVLYLGRDDRGAQASEVGRGFRTKREAESALTEALEHRQTCTEASEAYACLVISRSIPQPSCALRLRRLVALDVITDGKRQGKVRGGLSRDRLHVAG